MAIYPNATCFVVTLHLGSKNETTLVHLFGDIFGNYFFVVFGTFYSVLFAALLSSFLLHFVREKTSVRPLVLMWQRTFYAGLKKKSDRGGENKKELHER